MKRWNGIHLAIATLLIANAMALTHAAMNRWSDAGPEFEFSDRELRYAGSRDNKAVTFLLAYGAQVGEKYTSYRIPSVPLTGQDCRDFGFDCGSSYDTQPHRVIAAFEFNGDAWRAVEQARERAKKENTEPRREFPPEPRLIFVGIGRDPASLRARYPDRARFILLPAAVRLQFLQGRTDAMLSDVPAQIHVPLPFAEQFRPLSPSYRQHEQPDPLYKVRVRFGSKMEPWVTGVEIVRPF